MVWLGKDGQPLGNAIYVHLPALNLHCFFLLFSQYLKKTNGKANYQQKQNKQIVEQTNKQEVLQKTFIIQSHNRFQ